jgi:hypothetical protein
MKWELLRPNWNSPVTVFAGDNKLLAFLHREPHERIIMTEIIVKPLARLRMHRTHGSRGNLGLRLSLKTRTAQNRRATGRLKRNRCGRSTFGTIRLGFGAYPYLGVSLGLAFLAAFWVVFEMFFDEEESLSSRENELGAAINALQNPVRKFHGLLSEASEVPECRVRVRFHGARMGVGKYVRDLTASEPRLYRVGGKAATRGLMPM